VTTKPFHIYRSSAGSGKTRVLARSYIQLALKRPDYFKYILAMTFTNKSTQEMKDRILHYLYDFTQDKSQDLANEIIKQLESEQIRLSLKELKERSAQILSLLLHRYSEFSISTIDAFFQRVIRSFSRETGLLGNFRLEVDNELMLEEVVNLLMDDLTNNPQLRSWVLDFSIEKLQQGENWDIRTALSDFARLMKDESFKSIEEDVVRATSDKDFFQTFKRNLDNTIYSIENHVKSVSQKMVQEMEANQLTADDFTGKSKGVFAYIVNLSAKTSLPSDTVMETVSDAAKWAHKSSSSRAVVYSMAQKRWQPQLQALVEFIEQNNILFNSASVVAKNLYTFGLLADLTKIQKKYLSDENLMLLSDAPKFLNVLMREQDTSFIYEKVGSFYRHYLLDEFQDTSGLQWNNLLPLVQNGLAQNYRSLIVGDIKQSIYRWRGGDLSILQQKVKTDVSELLSETHSLDTNYRSEGRLVAFNNSLFDVAAKLIAAQTGDNFPTEAYQDAAQKFFREEDKGYVNIQFLDTDKETSFEEEALRRLPNIIEDLQSKGVRQRDIAFLVRENKEGQKIAARFIEYKTQEAKEGFNYEVVSNESLMLYRASCVVVLINALRVIHNSADLIAKANLSYEYQKLWPTQTFTDLNEIFSDTTTKNFVKWVPPMFVHQRDYLASLSLFEMVENLIHIFNLGQLTDEIIYVQSFQDVVQEFMQREKNDVGSFLEWWEINREKKSIQVAGGVDAAQIITIHRAKGLQFKYVIIPFLDWELGHGNKSPMLWVKANHSLFSQAGFIPVKYTQSLESTYFKDYYSEETKRVYIDNLNVLYVAFTRAEEGMIALAPASKKKPTELKRVSQLVWEAIQTSEPLQLAWNEAEKQLTLGVIDQTDDNQPTEAMVALKSYAVTQWRNRLTLRKSGHDYFHTSDKRVKINVGVLMHRLLSKVSYADEAQQLLKQIAESGELSIEEMQTTTQTVVWLLNEPILSPFFSRDAIHKKEVSLFSANGEEKRIDRVAIKDQQAWVLDYKTGSEYSKDRDQVQEYMVLLSRMGYQVKNGYLVYVNEKRIEEVKVLENT
jgi:ATP-dependent exoDNAse (exonuclease V) beta subunit